MLAALGPGERVLVRVPVDDEAGLGLAKYSAIAHRVAQLRPRIEALGTRLAAAGRAQGEYLAGIAVDELEAQKQRLTSYQVQARFALASIYDRSADASGSEAAP